MDAEMAYTSVRIKAERGNWNSHLVRGSQAIRESFTVGLRHLG